MNESEIRIASGDFGGSNPSGQPSIMNKKTKETILIIVLAIWMGMFGIFYAFEARIIPVWLFLSIFFFNWFLEEWRDLGH